jgi:hypothetical protein
VAKRTLYRRPGKSSPLTDADAEDLIRSVRTAPALSGHGSQAPADIHALCDALLRVSRLADDLPQVAELDLNPVIVRPGGVVAVDAHPGDQPSPGRPFPAPASPVTPPGWFIRGAVAMIVPTVIWAAAEYEGR